MATRTEYERSSAPDSSNNSTTPEYPPDPSRVAYLDVELYASFLTREERDAPWVSRVPIHNRFKDGETLLNAKQAAEYATVGTKYRAQRQGLKNLRDSALRAGYDQTKVDEDNERLSVTAKYAQERAELERVRDEELAAHEAEHGPLRDKKNRWNAAWLEQKARKAAQGITIKVSTYDPRGFRNLPQPASENVSEPATISGQSKTSRVTKRQANEADGDSLKANVKRIKAETDSAKEPPASHRDLIDGHVKEAERNTISTNLSNDNYIFIKDPSSEKDHQRSQELMTIARKWAAANEGASMIFDDLGLYVLFPETEIGLQSASKCFGAQFSDGEKLIPMKLMSKGECLARCYVGDSNI
ncbi:uncharacterized protein LY89DRAFT_662978 [Mollisia scopiformis]|uniref:Uncharacterized protein n=1 Tax=Mollisia scopiformis TaxID=149040 RepID=A0A194XVH1_MOLSC|nr:uncharacterized protein LY89DRAFT_662978 [Mollisia scopiformis]KUJ24223.1 hypothetical protein LY89DRAFT_662978 [Mollisia scopiformis]